MKTGHMFRIVFGPLLFLCAISTAHAYIDRPVAVIRIMDKAAGKTHTRNVVVGQTEKFEKLSVTVRACKQTDPFDAENFFMFAEIYKTGDGKIYSGWMNRNEPGQNPLQNSDYDVWLVECNANNAKEM